ncbi:glycosyltransferase [Methylophaga sp.]|uniref:glycosyltransferase n=1 Tax=Methylophaga sp. TaxID=2024840 RepID=UPI003A9050BA
MAKRDISVLQLHQGYNIKPIDVADLAEQVIKALPPEKFASTTLFVTGKPQPGEKESCAERTIYLDLPKKNLRGLRLRALYELFNTFRREHFDVVICNRFKPTSLMVWLHLFIGRPKCLSVVHILSDYRPFMRRLMIKLIAHKWHFVAVSESVRQGLFALNCGFNERNVTVIENAIDSQQMLSLLYPADVSRKTLDLPTEKTIVGTIGRLDKRKGHIDLVRGFAKIHQQFPGVLIAIIGEGKERKTLEAEIASLGLSEKVFLLGNVDGAARYIKAFDIWIMPSHSEGLPLALMEAMTAKLPILTTSIPSMDYIVRPAGGMCFDVQNPDDLAKVLSDCLKLTPEQRAELGDQSFKYLQTHFSLQRYRNEYLSLIERLLNDR